MGEEWFAIAIYILTILLMAHGLMVSFSMDIAFRRLDLFSSSALFALKIWRVALIVMSLVGIFLILKKPRTQKSSGD
jgi:uncharacterized BrkB/YihY/UPF0761 family membrane protein